MVFDRMKKENFEQIVYCNDPKVGLKAIIALHSTVLGPATGGCRMWNYKDEDAALTDVLRLSKGMTYKAAISGLKWGGGKAVILGDSKTEKTPEKLRRFGEYVEKLGGHYITAKDVGIDCEDLKIIKTKTKHILGIEGEKGSSGDPSPATAWGVYHGMRACVKNAFGAESLDGLTIALQGLGSVSYYLLEHLMADGAKVVACDIDEEKVSRTARKYNIETIRPEAIYDVRCDVFSPSALGAVINPETLPRILMTQAKIVAGAANNQLATPEMGDALMRSEILYAPDYAINAGGLINIYHEQESIGGYSRERAFEQVRQIGNTIAEILRLSKDRKVSSHVIADQMAEERVRKASE